MEMCSTEPGKLAHSHIRSLTRMVGISSKVGNWLFQTFVNYLHSLLHCSNMVNHGLNWAIHNITNSSFQWQRRFPTKGHIRWCLASCSMASTIQCELSNWKNQILIGLWRLGYKIAEHLLHSSTKMFGLPIHLRMVGRGSIMLHAKAPNSACQKHDIKWESWLPTSLQGIPC